MSRERKIYKKGVDIMKDYTKFLKWAVVSFISRDTQDDHKDKLKVAGLFENPITPEDFLKKKQD